jgi:hypothetical protein
MIDPPPSNLLPLPTPIVDRVLLTDVVAREHLLVVLIVYIHGNEAGCDLSAGELPGASAAGAYKIEPKRSHVLE